MTETTATPLERIQLEAAAEVDSAVIWLHGLGADGNDFAPLFQGAGGPLERTRVLLPHAPMQPVTINGGMTMRAWYDIQSPDLRETPDLAGIRHSAQQVADLIRELEEAGIPAERIVLGGFSQGAVMALWTGLGFPRPLAGIAALSGYLPADPPVDDAQRATPVFMAHGQQDSLIPCHLGEAARDRLTALLDQPPRWRAYPMDHGVNEEEAAELLTWLGGVLTAD
jgi:phospholipase/carboxylesterase